MTNEQWTQELRQKMAGYRRSAPEVSWDELDRALAAGKARKTRRLWLRRMAAAAIFLLIASIGYWGSLHKETEQIQQTTALVNTSQGDRHTVRSENHLTGCLSPCEVSRNLSAMSESGIKDSVSAEEPDTVSTTVAEDEKSPRSNKESDTRPKKQAPQAPVIYPSDLRKRQHLDNRLTAKVYMSSTMTGSRQTESFNIPYVIPLPSEVGSDPNEEPNSVIIAQIQKDRHIHHRQPVRFGLSLRYRLTDCWSMESGLSYTRLSSDIITTENGITSMTEQRLNYLGLPLNIIYNLWQTRHFGFYVSAGGAIEKSLDTSPWQFSLNGAAGAEYKLTDFFSLYAEPGLGYYFKDGSTTPNIYQDRPLNFNLNLGLRFNLK